MEKGLRSADGAIAVLYSKKLSGSLKRERPLQDCPLERTAGWPAPKELNLSGKRTGEVIFVEGNVIVFGQCYSDEALGQKVQCEDCQTMDCVLQPNNN